ncbi:DUF6069 family protein [Phycicoccus sonneratiae]|uniref:Uncharacterized protein n=1 Tax=Phycicoccus sonneratiae TaxID=2807628 RepID=A0ABS2CQR8_9MICO|nr:DUF6069 family protein [Phycicoccus sonneraticus]MBM6402222.1 hypothetical protein [Phycicoccus sonneraticus]
MTTRTDHTPTTAPPTPSTARTPAWLVVTGSTAAALLAWWPLGTAVDLVATSGGSTHTVGGVAVTLSAAVVALAALGVGGILRRTARRPRRAFGWVSLVVLVLSMAGPVLQADTGTAAVALATLHVVVAAVVVPLVVRRLPVARS